MSKIVELKEKFKKALSDADALRGKYQGKTETMTADEERQFDAYLDEAENTRKEIERVEKDNRADALKAWGEQSAGQLPLAGGRKDDTTDTDEEDPEGMKSIGLSNLDPRYSRAIKATAQPGYKAALVEYIRCQGQTQMMSRKALKDLSEGVDSEGGFWVPEDFRQEIIKKLPTMVTIRGLARVVTTSRDRVTFPKEQYDTDDRYTSAMRMQWIDETPDESEIDAADHDPGQLNIDVRTGMARKKISKNLLEDDAFDILGYVQQLFTESFSLGENAAFISGDGRGKPFGLFNSAGPNFPKTINSGDANTVKGDSVIEVFYGLPVQYRNGAVWLFNSNTAKTLRKLKDNQGRYLWDSMSQGGISSGGDRDTLLGKDVKIDEFCPDIAAGAHPIAFGDPKGYYIVDRVGLSIEVLREIAAQRNQIVVLGRKRVGGDVGESFRFRIMKVAA